MKKNLILISGAIICMSFTVFQVNTLKDKKGGTKSLEFDNMDKSANPAEDFYQYANGNWLANNPIPESESRWSSFNELDDRNNNVLHNILENSKKNPGEKGSASQLIGDYYYTFSDTVTRNKQGIDPLKEEIKRIAKVQSTQELPELIAHLHNIGVGVFYGVYVEQDAKINTKHQVYVSQGGLGLPNKDYYFNKDERSVKIRDAYMLHIHRMFDLTEMTHLKEKSEIVFQLEAKLAEHSMAPVELRDMEKQYNKMTTKILSETCPSINWKTYFKTRGLSGVDSVIVGQPAFMKALDQVLMNESIHDIKAYMQWQLINDYAGALSMDLDRANFDFYSTTMRGTKKQKPLWKRGIQSVTFSSVGEALGKAFVEENFSEEAKRKVNEMVDNITLVFEDRIEALDWMSAATKVKAKEKLGAFARKLGFPDEWKDFSSLDISRESYLKNVMNSRKFRIQENLDKYGKGIDKSEWGMVPQIVNAYYNPLLNEIVFPAGIMQAPFFSEEYEDAVNYARMGAVIGHELTHGFDDQGAQFDAEGRMQNWWTEEDKAKFDAKTQKLIDQYNSFEVLEGVFVNGELTLGENIADLGGLTIAYHAYQKSLKGKGKDKINGFTNEQRFFLAFAQVWKNNIRDNALIARIKGDPHSPGKYRVNGTLSNMPEFFEAFNIKEGSAMRQPADKIAKIW